MEKQMKYNELVKKLKNDHKQLVIKYTELKRSRSAPHSLYTEVRYKHIAYCMLRGRSFEQIESKWKDPSSSVNAYIQQKATALLADYTKMVEHETVCVNS